MHKACCTCKILKPLDNFCKNKSTKDGYNKRCKPCVKIYSKPRREYFKKYKLENKSNISNKSKIYYQKTKDIQSEYKKIKYYKNKSIYSEKSHFYYENNKEKIKQKVKNYNSLNKEQKKINNQKRKAIKKQAYIENIKYKDIIDLYGNKCYYCGRKFEHIDHYIPLSKGGEHSLKNVRPSCANCNLRKQDKMPDEFLELVGKK